jgi:hypothetical protein
VRRVLVLKVHVHYSHFATPVVIPHRTSTKMKVHHLVPFQIENGKVFFEFLGYRCNSKQLIVALFVAFLALFTVETTSCGCSNCASEATMSGTTTTTSESTETSLRQKI